MPEHPYTIAVDFDGVVHAYSRGWADLAATLALELGR